MGCGWLLENSLISDEKTKSDIPENIYSMDDTSDFWTCTLDMVPPLQLSN